MGRRKKAAKKIVQKKKHVVPTQFKCLFCNSEGSVACKLSLSSMVGQLQCRVCDARFETQINSLTDPIDVFSEWLDEAEELQEEHNKQMSRAFLAGEGGDDEGGVEMVEPAAKRARVGEPTTTIASEPEKDPSEPNFDVLKGLEVDSDDEEAEGEKEDKAASEDQEEQEAAPEDQKEEDRIVEPESSGDKQTGKNGNDGANDDEGNDTWKDVASPVPPAKAPAVDETQSTQLQPDAATQPQADANATQAQPDDNAEDLF